VTAISKERKQLVYFIESSECFDNIAKPRLILTALGVKPGCYCALKITPKNLDDKFHFEAHLKRAGLFFKHSPAKSFEEISEIRGNAVMWSLKGAWYGYDIFNSRDLMNKFRKYADLSMKNKHAEADRLAGLIYGYPACCIKQYVRDHKNNEFKLTYDALKKAQDLDKKFPFVSNNACSLKCRKTSALNKKYETALKTYAKHFYRQYSAPLAVKTDLIVEGINALDKGNEYALLSVSKINGHHMILSYISREKYEQGAVLGGIATIKYDYADIKIKKVKKMLEGLHHIRKLPLLGKK